MLDFLCLCIKHKFIIKANLALDSILNSKKYGSIGAKRIRKKEIIKVIVKSGSIIHFRILHDIWKSEIQTCNLNPFKLLNLENRKEKEKKGKSEKRMLGRCSTFQPIPPVTAHETRAVRPCRQAGPTRRPHHRMHCSLLLLPCGPLPPFRRCRCWRGHPPLAIELLCTASTLVTLILRIL
jgi:hypothetical protein